MNKVIVVAGIAFSLAQMVSLAGAQEPSQPVKAVSVIGLPGVKGNQKGSVKVDHGNLMFVHDKAHADISASTVSEIVTGADSQRAVGGAIGTTSMAAPYGSGRFLSLFRKKVDTLCVQYRDGDGSLHGVLFTMPVGAAEGVKKQLVAQGADAGAAPVTNHATTDPNSSSHPEEKPATASMQAPATRKSTAIQVLMIHSDETQIPAEFRIALYENLLRQLEKHGKFQRVYREGSKEAAGAPDLIILHSSIRGFKQGSERARQVTTVAGATSIKVHCRFTGADGQTVFERDVDGKVRFFGGNLRATYDFAKKAANVTDENLSAGKAAHP